MKRGSFAAGFLTCLLLAGVTTTAYAAGIVAERSHHRIVVDGKEAQMEAMSSTAATMCGFGTSARLLVSRFIGTAMPNVCR